MKKTISINLGGASFVIDDDAYERLRNYLEEISAYFREIGDAGGEVIEDIESRIAEQLRERLEGNKRTIVTRDDVEGIIQVVGTVSDIREESGDQPVGEGNQSEKRHADGSPIRRRLYRDPDEAMIAGVCAGLGAYLDMDPLWIRLVFAVSVLFGGSGIPIYLILWLVMPLANTPQQKMEMHGEDYTLAGWRERLGHYPKGERAGADGDAGRSGNSASLRARRGAQLFVALIGRILQAIMFIVGLVVVVASALLIAAFVISVLAFIGVGSFAYALAPVSELLSPLVWWLAVAAVAWLALVPVMFLMTLGASLMNRKSEFRLLPSLGLIGSWVLAAIVLGMAMIQAMPIYEQKLSELDDVNLYESQVISAPIDSITVRGIRSVSVEYGEEPRVVLRGPGIGLESLVITEFEGELSVKADDRIKVCLLCRQARQRTDLVIVTPRAEEFSLRSIHEVSVAGALAPDSTITARQIDSLTVQGDGLSGLRLELMDVDSTELTGSAETLDIEIDGWFRDKVQAFGFPVRYAELSVLGAETLVEVNVSDRLTVESDGLSSVVYRGEPEISESIVDPEVSTRHQINFGGDVIYVEEYGHGGFTAVTPDGNRRVQFNIDDAMVTVTDGGITRPATLSEPVSVVRPEEPGVAVETVE